MALRPGKLDRTFLYWDQIARMKKLLFTALAGLFISLTGSAQVKAVQTVIISTPTIQCDMCKKSIEDVLKRYDGVSLVKVNVKKKEVTVKYLTDRVNDEILKTAIANAGYDANEIAANPESYERLPKCCKKPKEPATPKQ
jgi:copper chaperone CopZ